MIYDQCVLATSPSTSTIQCHSMAVLNQVTGGLGRLSAFNATLAVDATNPGCWDIWSSILYCWVVSALYALKFDSQQKEEINIQIRDK